MTNPVTDGQPSIPPRVRTIAYCVSLAVGALTILAQGITAAVAPEAAPTVLAVCGAVTGAVAAVVGGLGVAFRPTAGQPAQLAAWPAFPPRIDGDTWGDGSPVTAPVIGYDTTTYGDVAPVYDDNAVATDLAPEIR